MHSESSFPQRSPETAPPITIPSRMTYAELASDEPEAVEKFTQNETTINLLDTLTRHDSAVQNPDVSAAIGMITDNALRIMGRTPDNRDFSVVVRQPRRAIILVGGLKRHNPEAYESIYDSAAFLSTQVSDASPGYANKIITGFFNTIIAVEAGDDPDARTVAHAALEQRNRDIEALFKTDL